MFSEFSMRQFVSAFVVLFAVIDVLGSVPIILKLKRKGKKIRAGKIALWSFLMFIGFFYIGEFFLHLFKLDMSSFAIAGSLIIFVMAMEMILDIEIFREGPDTPKDSVFVPLVFPLIAGAGHPVVDSRAVCRHQRFAGDRRQHGRRFRGDPPGQADRAKAGTELYLYAAKVFRHYSAGHFG